MCHNGQCDVPVTCEARMTSDISQPRAASSCRCRSSVHTRVGGCVSLYACGGVSWCVRSDSTTCTQRLRQ